MLTRDEVLDRLDYDETTGTFTYKRRVGRAGKGTVAGHVHKTGYVHIFVDGQRIMAHRLAWFCAYGEMPNKQVDHIDGNRANNAISNLRLCNQSQNQANTKKPASNTSGFKGVSWHRRVGKWGAQIKINGQQKHLGYFHDKKLAGAAYADALVKNFGNFARTE